jgi:glutathione S-transferase
MQLFGSYTSPYVRHCRVALMQGNLDFDFIEADYAMSAEKSPTSKVPFFTDGDLTLTDSSSIIKYAREKSGKSFLADINDYELFAMSNTLLDTGINVFLLEKDGATQETVKYLGRQKQRIESGLVELNRRFDPADGIAKDSALRCVCFLDWALFRNRISLDGLDNLAGLLEAANGVSEFAATRIPS